MEAVPSGTGSGSSNQGDGVIKAMDALIDSGKGNAVHTKHGPQERPEDNAFTMAEFRERCKAKGVSRRSAQAILRKQIQEGRVQTLTRPSTDSVGRTIGIPCYKFVQDGESD